MTREVIEIGPQRGPQTAFLESTADIAIYGGAAGGGKSYALLLEPLRHLENKDFGAVIFRRNSKQVKNEGGLWDESVKLYSLLDGKAREFILEWEFRTGVKIKFDHLESDKTVYNWQGSQIPLICFDELTHFTEFQFFYMMSRNRSTSGVPGYIRCTTNPDCDSWVREFIDWWIDDKGFPIKERSGVIRWFIKVNDCMYWADTAEELKEKHGPDALPKSVTFIASKIEDNQILMQKDPSYLANLNALSRVERARLKDGNWNIRASAGTMFRTEWFEIVDAVPAGWIRGVRFWDRAATIPHEANKDPDWTRGLKMYAYPDGSYLVADLRSARDTPNKVNNLIKNIAAYDTTRVKVMSQQDPGSAGKFEIEHFFRMLAGYNVGSLVTSKDKVTRSQPVSSQCEAGNVKVLRSPWNREFFSELENFPDGAHDDIVDCLSGAFNELVSDKSIFDVL